MEALTFKDYLDSFNVLIKLTISSGNMFRSRIGSSNQLRFETNFLSTIDRLFSLVKRFLDEKFDSLNTEDKLKLGELTEKFQKMLEDRGTFLSNNGGASSKQHAEFFVFMNNTYFNELLNLCKTEEK